MTVRARDIPIPLADPPDAGRFTSSAPRTAFRPGAHGASSSNVLFLLVIGALVGGIGLLAMSVARPDGRARPAPVMALSAEPATPPLGAVPPIMPLSPPVIVAVSEPAPASLPMSTKKGAKARPAKPHVTTRDPRSR
jgi:hypothetical protein